MSLHINHIILSLIIIIAFNLCFTCKIDCSMKIFYLKKRPYKMGNKQDVFKYVLIRLVCEYDVSRFFNSIDNVSNLIKPGYPITNLELVPSLDVVEFGQSINLTYSWDRATGTTCTLTTDSGDIPQTFVQVYIYTCISATKITSLSIFVIYLKMI